MGEEEPFVFEEQTNECHAPCLYMAHDLTQWDTSISKDGQHWFPCRPHGFSGIRGLKLRIRLAWGVFTGRYDALAWLH